MSEGRPGGGTDRLDINWSFRRATGMMAGLVGIGGLAYAILFGLIVAGTSEGVIRIWLILGMVGGLAVTGVFVGLHQELRASQAIVLWALLLGLVAGLGQMLNASVALGYSLDTAPSPPGRFEGTPDPLGILRFGVNGLALFLFGWVMARGEGFPRALAYLGQLGGVLLVVMYAGRLTGLIDPGERLTLIPPLVYGFLVHPVFYVWLSRHLLRPPPDLLR